MDKPYSLSRGIISMLDRGAPTGAEADFHFGEALRRSKAAPSSPLAGLMAGGRPALHVPLTCFERALSAGGSGANLIGEEKQIISPLLTWSAGTEAGATMLTGLEANVSLAHVSKLGEPVWSEENAGFEAETDPEFAAVPLGPPKRLSGLIKVSRQLLVQGGSGLDQFLANDLSRACSRQLDRIAFYGTGVGSQPRGIRSTPGIHVINIGTDDPAWEAFCDAEKRIEDEDMGPNSAFVTSPALKAELRRRPLWVEGSGQTLWDSLTNPISSKAISGEQEHIFFGNFPVGMVIGVWGDSADIVINRFTEAATAFVTIVCFLWCSVAIRSAKLFGVMTLPLAPPPEVAKAPPKAEAPEEEPAKSWTEPEKGNNKKK